MITVERLKAEKQCDFELSALPRRFASQRSSEGIMRKDVKKSLTLIQCNATLEVLHAHLVRASCANNHRDWILVYPEWVAPVLVLPGLWTKVIAGCDTRPEYGNIAKRLRDHLCALRSQFPFDSYSEIELIVSDLSWLMNNVLLAWLSRFCSERGIEFKLSFLDEGAVLYTGTRMHARGTLKSFTKYVFLKLNGFPSVFIHPKNRDYLHGLSSRIYCLHPELLNPPPGVTLERIHPELLERLYGDRLQTMSLPSRSCLYLSQPLYKVVGIDRQLAIVESLCKSLRANGISQLFYKAHHADLPNWCHLLEKTFGFQPVAPQQMLPIEMLASRCDAALIVSHVCSALLNLKSYGYQGRVIAYGINQLSGAFQERAHLQAYLSALERIGDVEVLATSEAITNSCADLAVSL